MNQTFVKRISTIWVIVSLISVGATLYLVGRIDASESGVPSSIQVMYPDEVAIRKSTVSDLSVSPSQIPSSGENALVASKNGTRYYTPGCSGIGRIKEENRVYFDTVESAEAEGLTLAQACQ